MIENKVGNDESSIEFNLEKKRHLNPIGIHVDEYQEIIPQRVDQKSYSQQEENEKIRSNQGVNKQALEKDVAKNGESLKLENEERCFLSYGLPMYMSHPPFPQRLAKKKKDSI